MPRKVFANNQEKFEYLLLRIASGEHKDNAAQAKIRLWALFEWAAQVGITLKRVSSEALQEDFGVKPAEVPAPVSTPKNVLEELEGRH